MKLSYAWLPIRLYSGYVWFSPIWVCYQPNFLGYDYFYMSKEEYTEQKLKGYIVDGKLFNPIEEVPNYRCDKD